MKKSYIQKAFLSAIFLSGMLIYAQSPSADAGYLLALVDNDRANFTTLNAFAPPGNLSLSSHILAENAPASTLIGIFTATDPDLGDVITFSLPAGIQDNNLFNLNGSTGELKKNSSANFEDIKTYSIKVRATDALNEFTEADFTINITDVNEPPTDLTLTNSTIDENLPAASVVGSFIIADPDINDPHTIVFTAGGADNNLFNISGSQLITSQTINFEVKNPLQVELSVSDGQGLSITRQFSITVIDVNEAPTDIALTSTSIAENQPIGTTIGTLSSTDPDAGETFSYTLAAGGTDNASFKISGNLLQSNAVFNHEVKESYSIRIQTSDGTLSFEENFVIQVNNVVDEPTDIALSAATIAENKSINTLIGTFTTTDPDGGEPYTYTFAAGGTDNASFLIADNQLRSNAVFNREVKSSYSIKIRTTDNQSNFFEKTFTITITDVPEQPTDITLSSNSVAENLASGALVGTLTATDPDQNETFTFTLPAGTADNASFTINSANELRTNAKFDFETKSSYAINIRCTDKNSLTFDKAFPINIQNVDEGAANITGGGTYCAGTQMPITLNIAGGNGPFSLILTRTVNSTSIDTTISSISVNPYTIYVRIPGTYTIKSLSDKDNNPGTVSTEPVNLAQNPRAKAILTPLTQAICKDGTSLATLHVDFTSGAGPFQVKVKRGNNTANDTSITSNADFEFHSRVFDNSITRHRIIEIRDKNGCVGDTTGSGSAFVSYKASPVATISGTASICPGASTPLTITLQGSKPWNITYRKDNGTPVEINEIQSSPYILNVSAAGPYKLSSVQDGSCTGTVSGEAVITALVAPVATLSGNATICEHTSTNLSVAITGNNWPWRFYYRLDTGDSIKVDGIGASPATIPVSKGGTYKALKIIDKNNCVGTPSGSALVTVTAAPNVTINIEPRTFSKEVIRVPVTVTPTQATYIPQTWLFKENNILYFWPVIAGVGTRNLIFSYIDPNSPHCTGYDTAVIRVIEANAEIFLEKGKTKYCTNDGPFKITGVNLPNKIGTFTLEGGVGLVNHGNNTATIYPKQLNANTYTITYTYVDDGTTLSVTKDFDVGNQPVANFTWATECYKTGQSIAFTNTSISPYGAFTDTSYFWKIYSASSFISKTTRNITHTFQQAGNQTIELQIENSYGCADTIVKVFPLRPTIDLTDDYAESFEGPALGWKSGNTETANSWQLGTPASAYTMPPANTKCWYTKITSTVPPSEHSWVTSPCYDFTHADKPMVKMNIWRLFNLNTNADGANLQFSADSGKTWTLVGDIADGKNWYNSYVITGLPGGSGIGWSNVKDANWIQSSHSLDMLKGKPRVQFRITYGSDTRVRNTNGIAFDDFSIVDRSRMSLVEHFTNSSDNDTEIADALLDTFTNNNLAHVINIQYHTSSPAGDPFYADNAPVANHRQFYYGLSGAPYAILNGGTAPGQRFDYVEGSKPLNTNTVIIESLDESKFEINMSSKIDQVLRTKVQVGAREDIPASNISVKIAVIERVIKNITGQNGDQEFRNVVKVMLPSPSGTIYNRAWSKDEVVEIEKTWELLNVYNVNELRVVAFIQNELTHEIYQAAMDTIGIVIANGIDDPPAIQEAGFTIYPNPANQRTTVLFNEEIKEDVKIELFNSMGKLVHSMVVDTGESSVDIPLDSYPAGLYLMRLVTGDRLLGIRKVIVSR